MSGTDGHVRGSNGTCPQDGRNPIGELSRREFKGLPCDPLSPTKPWPGDSQHKSWRFAQIDSCESICRKKKENYIFITCKRFARIASNLRFAIFGPPESAIRKKGVRFGNPEKILENQAIRANLRISIHANLRIDSFESGHLSKFWEHPQDNFKSDPKVAFQSVLSHFWVTLVTPELLSGSLWDDHKSRF